MARADCDLLHGFSEPVVVAGQFFDVAQGCAQSSLSGGSAFVKLIECAHGGGVELLSIGENTLFGFE